MFKFSKKTFLIIGILLIVPFSQDAFALAHDELFLDVEIINFDALVAPQCFSCQLENKFVFPGEEFDYITVISNNGNVDANFVSLDMDITGQGSISANPSWDCFQEDANFVTCNLGELAAGEFIQVPFLVVVDSDAAYGTAFSATASLYAESLESYQELITVIDTAPKIPLANQSLLYVTMGEGTGLPATPGQSFSLNVSAYNKGPADAESVNIWYEITGPGVFSEDDLPAACYFEMSTGIGCTIPSLPPDSYFDNEITILVDQFAIEGQGFSNFVEVWSETEDPITEDNTSTWDYPEVVIPEIQSHQFDLSVDIELDTPEVTVGGIFSYFVVVTNDGPDDASYVSLDVQISGPGSIDAQSIPSQCFLNLQNDTLIFCDIGEILDFGDSQEISFAVIVDQEVEEGDAFLISAQVFYDDTEDTNPENDFVEMANLLAVSDIPSTLIDLVVGSSLESVTDSTLAPGQKFSQKITVSNNGPDDAELVNVTNSISGPGKISESDMPNECFVNPSIKNQIICSLGKIEHQKSKQVTLYWIIDSDAQDGQSFSNQYSATSTTDDPNDNQNGSFNLDIMTPLKTITTLDPSEELQIRTNEQQRVKSLQELEEILAVKLSILNEKETAYKHTLSTSNNKSSIIIAQEKYLEAKKDYLKILQYYFDKKPSPTDAELTNLAKLIAELKIEYEKFSYSQLFNEIYPKVETPIIEDFTETEKPASVPKKTENTKIYELRQALKNSPEQAELYAKSHGLEYKDEKTKVLVEVLDVNQISGLEKMGITIDSFTGNLVQVEVSIRDLERLSDLDFVKKIRPPTIVLQNGLDKITSEGVPVINADLVQRGGYAGKGVKMAVLDLGFDTSNQEILQNIKESKSFRYDFGSLMDMKGNGHEYVHGTAVAEVIVDVAPDVDLYLYSMGTETEFADAVDYAISQNMDVIEMSAGWLNYPTDGSSLMTKKIEQAINEGIVFVVSSGNYAQSHWEGKYKDSNKDGWNEFSGTDEGLTIKVSRTRADNNSPMIVYLLWYGSPNSIYNFDLSLTDPNGREVDYSGDIQNTFGDKLLEYVSFVPEISGDYSLGIYYSGDGTPDSTLEIFSPTDRLEYSTSSGSVGVPTDASGLIVTGAVHHADLSLQPYSSQGPTNHGNNVPSVVAPDAVATQSYGGQPFYGTSASAPHVAGIAALLLEKNPSSTPSEVKSLLETNADKLSVSKNGTYDNSVGYGKADSGFLIKTAIPDWIKGNAKWWADGQIDDATFLQGIQFLIAEGIMIIPPTTQSGSSESDEIPPWIKNNADWWAQGLITDDDFIKGIQFLVEKGIIQI